MSLYSPSIEKLIESFEKLPSIGHKTAQRLAFYMLDLSNEEVQSDIVIGDNYFDTQINNMITNPSEYINYCMNY